MGMGYVELYPQLYDYFAYKVEMEGSTLCVSLAKGWDESGREWGTAKLCFQGVDDLDAPAPEEVRRSLERSGCLGWPFMVTIRSITIKWGYVDPVWTASDLLEARKRVLSTAPLEPLEEVRQGYLLLAPEGIYYIRASGVALLVVEP